MVHAKRFNFIAADTLDKAFPPVTWLIEGQFPTVGLMTVFGSSGTYKTFYMLERALRISQQGTVVYFYGEAIEDADKRVKALADWADLSPSQLLLCPNELDVSNPTDITQVINELRDHKNIRMIIFDTLAEYYGDGDEDKARDMRRYNRGLKRLRNQFQTLVVSVHHTGRSDTSHERGSSALKAGIDVMVRLATGDGATVKVTCTKNRIAKKFTPETWQVISHFDSLVLEKQDELDPRRRQILHCLSNGDKRHGEIQQATRIPGSTLSRLLEKLKNDKFISQRDDYFHLLKKGRDTLAENTKVGPCSTGFSGGTESGTDELGEIVVNVRPVEQPAPGANNDADNNLATTCSTFHPFNSPALELEHPICSTLPPPYKGEVEQGVEEKIEAAEAEAVRMEECGQLVDEPVTFDFGEWEADLELVGLA